MAIIIKINGVDQSSNFQWENLEIEQILSSQTDNAHFHYWKYGSRNYLPVVGDDVGIYIDANKIFGGTITKIIETSISNPDGLIYEIEAADYTYLIDSLLVSDTYLNQTVQQVISAVVTKYAPGFTTNNVVCNFLLPKTVFNQVPISTVLRKLANIMQYDWYIDENKDVHFFAKYNNIAPYNLTDTSGNYINETLERDLDGTQLANVVKVRGGTYDGSIYTDNITVNGNTSSSFKLPYKFTNLAIKVNGNSKIVGIDNVDSFNNHDVLYNFTQDMIRFPAALNNGDLIAFSGLPQTPVLAVASDAVSIATYGQKEKLIRDKTIRDLTVARQRASAELAAYKDVVATAKFQTFTPGLRTGMAINITSAKRGANTDFLIKHIHFTARTPSTFLYEVEMVTTREHGIIELLQKLIEPDPQQLDDAEVSEVIKTDQLNISVVELITKRTPISIDAATVTNAENIQKDPLGAGVEPIWVLAVYFPASINDPKRQGRLDYSLKVY